MSLSQIGVCGLDVLAWSLTVLVWCRYLRAMVRIMLEFPCILSSALGSSSSPERGLRSFQILVGGFGKCGVMTNTHS